MGAGKTTIGQRLGEVLQLPVIDTDAYIEQQVGKTITEILRKRGRRHFERTSVKH
ncbi:Shikimate kinase [Anoxybacillus sp. BCO1]|nr:Shikimate kinase [Anoxybacillus sp. BCO1]